MTTTHQQTAAALVDLARAIAATSEADTYQDGPPMTPAVSLYRPSAAVVALLADKAVVEFFAHGSVGQWSIVPRRERSCPRRWFSLRWWSDGEWFDVGITDLIPTDLKKACRVVPAADADKDPRTRGPIEGGSP